MMTPSLTLTLTILSLVLFKKFVSHASSKHVLIIVFGDFERSPRMMNHLNCLLLNGFTVDVVAYCTGTRTTSQMGPKARRVNFIQLTQPTKLHGSHLMYLARGIWRVAYQFIGVFFYCYLLLEKPKFILIQNPPSMPTLLLAQFLSIALSSRLIIDWHNFGYSILAMERPKGSGLVSFAERYEKVLGRKADVHLTVTKAMAQELESHWHVDGKLLTLYDKAPGHITVLSSSEKLSFLSRIQSIGTTIHMLKNSPLSSTLYTTFDFISKSHTLKPNTPAIIVSSTSWTVDEDFSILLDALKLYNAAKERKKSLPPIHCIITGKGPLKNHYMSLAAAIDLEHVSIFSAWLEASEYPKLLSTATLGVSLHTSSSGLDLPMKVVDMFAAGTPVLALDFECIDELVENGKNGYTFKDAKGLSSHLIRLLLNDDEITSLRKGVEEFRKEGWESNWNSILLPVLESL